MTMQLALRRWWRESPWRGRLTLVLFAVGPLLALLTITLLARGDEASISFALRGVLLLDMAYVLVVAALVARRIVQIVAQRRAHSAGSRLHTRLVTVFAMVALIPTVLLAIFATLTLNLGLEGWFSDRVKNVVGTSLAAATAYEDEHRVDLSDDINILAAFLQERKRRDPLLSGGQLREYLSQGQAQMQRGLKEAFVIDGAGEITARGERSYLFNFDAPSPEAFEAANAGRVAIIEDWDNNEFRALVKLAGWPDSYLYIARTVDGEILNLLDETKDSISLYNELERERGRLFFEFGLIYLGFALVVILASVWLALVLAERIAGPVGRLAGAAQRVGAGDFDAKVPEEQGDDEIALLGRMFNRMTRQVKNQRDALVTAHDETEMRRRLFDSVLSGVSAGVIGLDAEGRVELSNRSALRMLDRDGLEGAQIAEVVPEFAPLFDKLSEKKGNSVQAEIRLQSGGGETLLTRLARRYRDDGAIEGYVMTFDDVTDLVAAQRMAAWGDVARRIAHEIKNPLTPIQLSAERVKRKFGKMLGDEDRDALEQYSDVIVRQTNDLRRIVDEFSKFARMPEPQRRDVDLGKVLRDTVALQREGDVQIDLALPEHIVTAHLDETMIGQALTNLTKNAVEATQSYREEHPDADYAPRVIVSLQTEGQSAIIAISDNGIGLPEDRARLFEPYVTTRASGTGLGLPIVKKIIEEHGGELDLMDAPEFEGSAHQGALARIVLPVYPVEERGE
ncbi:ATP-binding protein [Paracoccaceae bacterium GXU_MW_L88]